MSERKLTIAMLILCLANSICVVAGITSDENESSKLVIYVNQGKEMIVTPTYHVFEMFKVHQGATMLPSDLVCHQYQFQDQQIPALVVSASKDAAGKVHISICNLNPNKNYKLECIVEGYTPQNVSGRVLTSKRMTDHNTFKKPDVVRPVPFRSVKVDGDLISATIPAKSVVVFVAE